MLNRIIKLATVLSCGLTVMTGLIGCVSERIDIEQPEEGGIGLVLEIGSLKSRAEHSGTEFTKAEKLVKTVDLFFFAADAGDETQCTYYIRTNVAMNTEEAESNKGKIRINVEPKDLFMGDATTCKVYAVVNTDAAKQESNTPTITLGKLKDTMTSTSDWIIKEYLDEDGDLADFEGFVMFTANPYGDEVTLGTDAKGDPEITGTVIVDKLISKIDLFLGFGAADNTDSVYDWTITAANPNGTDTGQTTWKVYIPTAEEKDDDDESVFGDAVELYIVNGVKAARLGGAFDGDKFLTPLKEEDYFDLWAEDTEHDDNDFMNYAHGFADNDNASASDKTKYPYIVESPFYTYPNSWSDGVLNTDTYLILKVNWIPDEEDVNVKEELLETYYKVPLNKGEGTDQNKILSNKHYRVKVKINTLGGLHFGEPLLLDDCSYEVIPWQNKKLDAKLRETRYLEVRQTVSDRDGTVYTGIMNNSDRIEIPFYSSHKVEIRSAKMTYYDFQYAVVDTTTGDVKPTDRTEEINTETKIKAFTLTEDLLGTDTPGIYIDEIGGRIILQHLFHPIELSGDRYVHVTTNKGSGQTRVLAETYSPFDFEIELKHKGHMNDDPEGTDFELDKITVRQYPARYVEITKNQGGPPERPWLDFTGATTRNYGYVLINGARDNFGGASGIRTGWFNSWTGGILGYTENPMMYIVNVTNLNPEDVEEYPLRIGDPRMIYTSNNLFTPQEKTGTEGTFGSDHYTYEPLPVRNEDDNTPASWSYSAKGWFNHNDTEPARQLTDYYPTNETPINEYRYMVSPSFRIGSSYGNAGESFGRVRARKRCASYQEENYPAGRWRLPTPGELFFMVKLSQENVIPPLFSENENYWTSHGLYKVRSKTITEQRAAEGAFSGLERVSNGDEGGSLILGTGHYVIKGYTRCVYDEWYWKAPVDGKPDILNFELKNNASNDFRWGDKKKNNPQVQPPKTEEGTDNSGN